MISLNIVLRLEFLTTKITTPMDNVSSKQRSINMSRVKGKNTRPEMTIRSLLHKMGYRFRLHNKKLPGNPDIILPKYKTIIFVHGCFWHQHEGCRKATIPQTNTDFWKIKLSKNVSRDSQNNDKLISLGWKVVIIWECELKNIEPLKNRIKKILIL
ncbi:MAG: DNA mismatch endonuclease Vsr [Victivallales bacterium]|jgi:DNA mismatch endonuclease (patch repair protein)